MELNKIENQIREKLNSREIQPSAQAWDRLDAMLSVAEEKKTKRSFGWLYIAASILVFATLGMFFFSQKNTEINTQNNVVDTEVKNDSTQKAEPNFQNSIVEKTQENNAVVSSETQNPKSEITNNNQRVSITNQKTPNNQKQSNPLINRDKQIEYQNSSDVALKDLPKIQTGTQIIISSPKTNSSETTDEQLLASLDKSAMQSTNKQSNVKVDARNLLSQVDGELELTFRQKVLSKVAKNYKEVKVALANRNNE